MDSLSLTKILQLAKESPYKEEHSDLIYVRSCNSPSAIAYCYQSLCLVQKLDRKYCRKEPKSFNTILVHWFQSVFKITGWANCFEKNIIADNRFFRLIGKAGSEP